MNTPLMPKSTAVWLVENTTLTFKQIADFCHLHELEVQAIADGDLEGSVIGMNPITNGQLTIEEIEKGQKDPNHVLQLLLPPKQSLSSGAPKKYTPLSKRQDKPDAIYWLIKHHPELSDGQIIKLIGTTKNTIQSIRERTHWNMKNIKAQDPISLGLCRTQEIEYEVTKAEKKKKK